MSTTDRKLRVFLCHASEDRSIVRILYLKLLVEGWIEPWMDKEKILGGQAWEREIEKSVEAADAVIVCLSKISVEKEGYFQKELRKVLDVADQKPEGTIFLIPLRLEDCVVPRRLREWQWIDFFPKREEDASYQRIVKSLLDRAAKLKILKFEESTIFSAVETYFDGAGDERDHNLSIAGDMIARWGDQVVTVGLQVIRDRLTRLAADTMRPSYILGQPTAKIGDELIMANGYRMIVLFNDVVATLGPKAFDRLIFLLSETDEDIVALAAMMLSSDSMARPEAKALLNRAYRRVFGTGCRMAIAFALLRIGDRATIRDFIPYLLIPEAFAKMERQIQQHHGTEKEEMERALYVFLTIPAVPHLVSLEIATNGKAPRDRFPDWRPNQ